MSTAGGARPIWRKDGKELFLNSLDQQIMAVDVHQNGTGLQLGTPYALFKATAMNVTVGTYTASADSKKFVVNTVLPQSLNEPLALITDWPADLKQ